MKRFVLGLVLVLSFAVFPNLGAGQDAVQENDFVLSADNLYTSSFSSGKIFYELRTPWDINVSDLIYDIDPTKGETADSIHDKIDAQRQRLYPDQEIVLIITNPKPAEKTAVAGAVLVKSLFWWNKTTAKNGVWSAEYSSTVAVGCMGNITGKYNLYDKVGTGAWIFRYLITTGGGATRYTCGTLLKRGFKALALENSKADVVIYFFK